MPPPVADLPWPKWSDPLHFQRMTVGDVIASPYTWSVIAVSFAAGWYVKSSFIGAFTYGTIAPAFLVAVWMTICFCLLLPALSIKALAPTLWSDGLGWFRGLPDSLQFVLHPCTILTACAFGFYCRSAREVADLPLLAQPGKPSEGPQPFRRRIL